MGEIEGGVAESEIEGGVAEIGDTCGCLYTVCILFVYSDVYCLYTLMYSVCIL